MHINLIIDLVPMVAHIVSSGPNLVEFNICNNIFTEYGQEDLLMCFLWEDNPVPGASELFAIINNPDESLFITPNDCIEPEDSVLRKFKVEIKCKM